MRTLIISLRPFKDEDVNEVKKLLADIFKNTTNNTEIIVMHDCKNPECPMGRIYGVIGSEEDAIMIENAAKEAEKEEIVDTIKNIMIVKQLASLPKSVIDNLKMKN